MFRFRVYIPTSPLWTIIIILPFYLPCDVSCCYYYYLWFYYYFLLFRFLFFNSFIIIMLNISSFVYDYSFLLCVICFLVYYGEPPRRPVGTLAHSLFFSTLVLFFLRLWLLALPDNKNNAREPTAPKIKLWNNMRTYLWPFLIKKTYYKCIWSSFLKKCSYYYIITKVLSAVTRIQFNVFF